MEKAIVTGGAGFIGSHLTEALVKQGYRVTVIDDLSTGKPQNIYHLKKDIEFIKGSITDLPLLKKSFKNADYVFHMAAISSVPKSVANPIASHEVNNTGTLNVLQAAAQNHAKKLVFMSSAAVYGDIPTLPLTEDMAPRPKSPYAADKLSAEYYCQVFREVYQLPSVCLRCFNIYGPRQDPNSEYAAVIPKFIQLALEGKPLVIFGDGEQTRDFAYVKDIVEANMFAARSDIGGIFNISGGKSVTVNNLAALILKLTGNKSSVIHDKPRPGDIIHSLADVTRAETSGFKTGYSMEAGLAETIKHFTGCR
jgi:UDP-glucose 4-epimerase